MCCGPAVWDADLEYRLIVSSEDIEGGRLGVVFIYSESSNEL